MAQIPVTINNGVAPFTVTITNASGSSICTSGNCGGPYTTTGTKNIDVTFPQDGQTYAYTVKVTDSSGGTGCMQTSSISQKCDPPIGCPGLTLTVGSCSGNTAPLTATVGNSTSIVSGQYAVKLQRLVSDTTWTDVSSQNVTGNNTTYNFSTSTNGTYKVVLVQQASGVAVTNCESASQLVNCCTLTISVGSVSC